MSKKQIILLIGPFLLMGVIIVFFGIAAFFRTESQPENAPFPTPTSIQITLRPEASPANVGPSPSAQTIYQNQIAKQQIISLMPIKTDLYNIEYLYVSDEFIVTIKESPYIENKQQAEAWFANHGIPDINVLTITWAKYRFVE